MNLRSLRVFVGIMDTGTLTDAAQALRLSQSAASRLLALLEAELAQTLFLREKRQLVPTEAAEALYPEALRILAQIGALSELVSRATAQETLRIICHSRIAGGLVVPALAEIARAFPDAALRLETAPRRELARRVLAGRYDFAVAALPLSLDAAEAVPLAELPLGVVLPRGHHLANASCLDLADLRGEPYIALDETTAVRRAVDAALEAREMDLRPQIEVSTGINAYRLVMAGLGFTFADDIALDPELRPHLMLIPVDLDVTMKLGYFDLSTEPGEIGRAFRAALERRALREASRTEP